MNRLGIYAAGVLIVFLMGFGIGWHQKTVRVNAATVKQVVKAAQIDAKNESQVEKQNERDKVTIRQLEDALVAARRDAAARGVPKPPVRRCVSSPQGDAGAGGEGAADRESARRYEAAYRTLRDELLIAGADAEQLRLQVLACQAQWPR